MQQAVENPQLISLAAGLVDAASLPSGEVEQVIRRILSSPESAQAALQYGTTQGYAPLRDLLLRRTCGLDGMDPTDLALTPNNVVVTTGSQQFLYLLGETLLDPGDIVITEAPSYFVYQGTLASLGARTLSVPMDDEGMRTDLLEELLERMERSGEIDRVRMIYTIDYFQNPSGLSLSLPRRKHLMDLVRRYSRKHRIIVLEDAAYRELRYDGEDLPSLKSLDADNEFVAQAMTFSKPCSPGLKTGYGLLPSDLVDPVLRLKGNHDFGSNNLTQHLLFKLLECGAYDRHVEVLREVYRGKRDTMLDALRDAFGDSGHSANETRWTHPHGGLYVWLAFPDGVDTGPRGPLMKAALHEGVLYVPGSFCYVNGENGPIPTSEARLSFGVAAPEQLREGILRLARAARHACPGMLRDVRARLAGVS
jgi:2-aminoadipate transaminase